MSIICSAILVGLTWEAYAVQSEEQPQPAVDSSLKQQADRLNNDANALAQKGDWKGALDKFNQTLELYRRAGDRRGEARVLTNIGIAYRELHDFTKALDYLQQALMLWRSIADSAEEAKTLVNIGLTYNELNDKQKVLDCYIQALPLLRETHNHHGEALILSGIGSLYTDLGDFQKALDYSLQSLSLYRAENDHAEEARILNFIGTIYWKFQGDNKKALDYLTQSLSLWRELKERTQEADTLVFMGGISAHLGDYSGALQHYTDAQSIYHDLKDQAKESDTLNQIGLFYSTLDAQKALDYYQQALSIRQITKDLAGQAEVLSNMGQTYDLLDQEKEAIESYKQAVSLWQALNNYVEAATNLYLVGFTYYNSLNEPEKALDPLKKSLELMQTHGGLWSKDAAITLARVYIDLGDRVQARKYLDLAIQLGKGLEHPWPKAILLSCIGIVYTQSGDYKPALESFNRAINLYKGMQDLDSEAGVLANIGLIYELQGTLNKALDYYEQSIQLQEEVRTGAKLEELKTGLSGKATDAYEGAIGILMKLNHAWQAFNYSERARARTFLDQMGNTRLDIYKGADAQLIEQEQTLNLELANLENKLREEYSKPSPQFNQGVIDSLQKRLARKQKDYEDLLIRIKLNNPEYASLVSVSSLTLPEVQKLLDKDTTLLSYFVTGEKTLAFVITRDSFETVELPISEKDLEAAITEFRDFPSLEDVPLPILRRLYAGLIVPLKPYLKTPMVGIIPHRKLNYLPFAALTDNGQRYFGDDYTLFYLPSASVLQFIQQKRKPDSGSAFVLAQSRATGLPNLRYVDQEARDVAKLYDTEPLIDSAATESAFRNLAGNYSIVHVAAHGELKATNPLFSHIILAPDANADGSLEVREVYGLDLQKTQLVVLSACQTQLGKQSRGDDIIGLNRAFIYAGTPTIVASLWNVDDEATNTLMTAFHIHLKQGMGKAAALQAAQAETRANHPHPYYWAAFVLTGDPGKMTQ